MEQALEISRTFDGDWGLTTGILFNLGPVLMELGQYADARRAVMETWEMNEVHGYPAAVAHCRVIISAIDMREGDLDGAERKLRSAIATFDSLNSTYWKAIALLYQSDVAEARCVRATVEDARDAKSEWEDRNTALDMFHAMHHGPAIVMCLDGLARRAARHGDFRRMAILHGSNEALRAGSDDEKLSPYFRALLERDLERARAAIGEAALADALAEGRTLTMDQAVEFARDE